jgi:hypothetical protein
MNSERRSMRSSTRLAKDGRSVFVRLRVDRRDYEFARAWAVFHAEADPQGTAEDQLEGYLSMALMHNRERCGWQPPEEIAALFAGDEVARNPQNPLDDGIPY